MTHTLGSITQLSDKPLLVDIDIAREQIDWAEERAVSMTRAHMEEVGKLHEEIGRLKQSLMTLAEEQCRMLPDWQMVSHLRRLLPEDLAEYCIGWIRERRGR